MTTTGRREDIQSRILIGLAVLNWLHDNPRDPNHMATQARWIVTSRQRGLQNRWYGRARALLEDPTATACDQASGPTADRLKHTLIFYQGARKAPARASWEPAYQASSQISATSPES